MIGHWADQNTPAWLFNVFDISERMGLSTRWVKHLIARHHIPKSYLRRPVRLAPGVIRVRKLCVLTPSALELLLAKHAGSNIPETINPQEEKENEQ